MPSSKRREAGSGSGPRKPDAAHTRQDILRAARHEFSEHGLSGARVDAIAARMRTTKRMLYYYFGSKEGLYLAVLEQVYGDIRSVEQELDLASLSPVEAIRRMIEFTFDYEEAHPEFIRLVSIENIHHGRHLAQSSTLQKQNLIVIDTLTGILERGRLPLGHRRGGPASDDQRVLLLSGFESPYIRDIVRLRPDRAATAGKAQADDRRCHNPNVGNNRRRAAAIRSADRERPRPARASTVRDDASD